MRNAKFIKIYANFLSRFSQLNRPLKVIFDCSNGTAGLVLKKFCPYGTSPAGRKTLSLRDISRREKNSCLPAGMAKLKTHFINDKIDGNFPAHGPDPLAAGATTQLQKAVKKQKADLGVIFDADADRIFFIDNRGRSIDPDAIARLLIWQLKPKKVIIDVRTGWLIKKFKIQPRRQRVGAPTEASENSKFKISISKVGHYFIKKLMRKVKADLGIERSGHYYFKDFFYADAAILAAIHVINAVSKLPYSLADFVDLLPQYYRSGEINIRFKIEDSRLRRPALRRRLQQGEGFSGQVRYKDLFKKIENKLKSINYKLKTKNYLDGLTMEFNPPTGGWWFNIRPSNTESLLRLNIEADSREILEKEKKRLTKAIKSDILKLET